ncbi:Protein kinase domain-containing protein [Plasmodiophora brassicae]|uniref:Protein kinase domain-containing protein n=1 Tax=Plasmodiophora brassicae TaxID=37360 RepID=A0A0G4IPH5_PLABS|nr:hypothetical protein PBRA_005706 [Plasmodiophora brassicae]
MADSIHEFRNELRGSYLTVGLPNVAPFVGFIVDRTLGPGIVTRFGEGGTVSQFLERNKFIPAHIRLRLAAELCTGVAGMHARNVVHGDINPKNVVIGFPNGVVGKFEVWIIDLSSARALSAQCTISYASPEQVRAGVTGDFRWGAPSDVWSLAMVALYCINGVAWEPEVLKRPQIGNDIFKACQLYLKELDDGRIWPALPPNLVSKSTADVIHACFTMDPERRPSSAALAAALEQEAYRLELLST